MTIGVALAGLELKTPLIGASGLFGYGGGYGTLVDYAPFGAIVAKTITLSPRAGNAPPRVADADSGLLNSIGLENVGVEAFLREELPRVSLPCKLIASVGGETVEEYAKVATALKGAVGIDAIEINISCPNVTRGCLAFGKDAVTAREVVQAVRGETALPLLVKLPPLVVGIEDVARAASDGGADALVVANNLPGMVIDLATERPALGGLWGGYSGRAVRPVSLLLVWKVAGCVDAPIVATGGIERAEDAVEFILAGASAFEIGSVMLKDLGAPAKIMGGLLGFMKARGYETIEEFRGKARQASRR